jgi:hypothetical protein
MALPALPTSWELDGVELNAGADGDGFSYLVKTTRGWRDGAPGNPQLTPRPTSPGAFRSPNYTRPRVIELSGIAQSPTKDLREVLSDTIAGLCLGPDDQFDLICHERTRSLHALVERQGDISVVDMPDGFTVEFNIQLVANDPRKYSTQVKSGQTTLAQTAVQGVVWNGPAGTTGVEWDGPAVPATGTVWQASSGSSGFISLDNDGTAPTPILFTITGPVTGSIPMPAITNVETGEALIYGGTMAAGDVMTIDTGTGLALLNGNEVGALFTRYQLFEIAKRSTTTVQFTASGPADTASLLAQWSDAY